MREYMENMAYVGIVGQMLGIPMQNVEHALNRQFGGKQKRAGFKPEYDNFRIPVGG